MTAVHPAGDVWCGVDRLLDSARDDDAIAAHSLQLLELRRRRRAGRPAPQAWVDDQRVVASAALALPKALATVRRIVDGPLVVLKGSELAALYPDRLLRPSGDLDLLVRDAGAVRATLLEAGLAVHHARSGDDRLHHLPPLRLAGFPLPVELHDRLNWVRWAPCPDLDELVAGLVPSATGVDGVSALGPVHLALSHAVHNWNHGPMLRAGHLLDLILARERCDLDELLRTAGRWGIRRLWDTSSRGADALLLGGPRSLPLALAGRHTCRVRQPSTIAHALSRYASNLWAPTPASALLGLSGMVADTLRPGPIPKRRANLDQRSGKASRPVARSTGDP